MLIGITGPAFSGKDTIANHLCWSHGFSCEAFADPLRDGLSSLFGLLPHHFDAKHKETVIEWIGKSPRELLQTLGTQWGRDLVNRQIWCRHMHRRLQEYQDNWAASVVIPDVRFVDEARFIHSHGGVIWRVIRPGAETTAHSDHTSEQEQQRIVADSLLINDGTIQELQRAVDSAQRALESDPHSPRFVAA
ncbi:MAG: deoxynucleotide monophosphate kinase [Candidatus Accumulibacter sp.]|uniref:deoxynucleotide monophosphate kinase family protein n=1 Tax=Accumulibacter sp. TaxID=2053492 RepID=UPI0025850CD1|nr:deoxynucleotide monophosphate kinase [Accumulibacter sp.]MBK8113582.1 deoxynucleotide monophosphate kinase [Accumulibacter sp.]